MMHPDRVPVSHHYRKQSGVALITVMLVVALAVIIAANMTSRLTIQMRRAENQQLHNQAYWYGLGAEQFAMRVLQQDMEDDPELVHRGQYWAQSGSSFPVEGGTIEGEIIDLQACFNLNALAGEDSQEEGEAAERRTIQSRAFQALLEEVGVDEYEAEQIAEATRDWIDADDSLGTSFGAEDSEYESLENPYLAANSPMAHASELRLVRGVSPAIYRKVRPFVCSIPQQTALRVNVNTLVSEQAEVLAAVLEPHLSVDQARDLISNRPENGYESLDEFWAENEVKEALAASEAQKQQIVIKSDYFKLDVIAEVDRARFKMESVIKRTGESDLQVIRRQFGGAQ